MKLITDHDSGEVTSFEMCASCEGMGGYDASTNCEEYDDWRSCEECNGTGQIEMGNNERGIFIPSRDAFTTND